MGEHQLHAEAVRLLKFLPRPSREGVEGRGRCDTGAAPSPRPPPAGGGESIQAACHQSGIGRRVSAHVARRHHHRGDLADLSANAGPDRRAGPGPDRHRRSGEIGADLLGTRLRRLRARRSCRRPAGCGDGGVVARQRPSSIRSSRCCGRCLPSPGFPSPFSGWVSASSRRSRSCFSARGFTCCSTHSLPCSGLIRC